MPFYMQYEGIDGSVRNADAFDFSQLTTEPTEAGAVAGIVIAATSDNNRVAIDDGADVLTGDTFDFVPQLTSETAANNNGDVDGRDFLVWQRGNATPASGPVGEDGGLSGDQLAVLSLPAVHDDGLLLPY